MIGTAELDDVRKRAFEATVSRDGGGSAGEGFPEASLVLKHRFGEVGHESLDDLENGFGDPWEVLGIQADLAERYAEGEVVAHLHAPGRLFIGTPQEPEPRCAVLHAAPLLGDQVTEDRRGHSRGVRPEKVLKLLDHPVGRKEAVGRIDEAVFVSVGEVGQDREGMPTGFIPSVVRLNRLDECPMRLIEGGDSVCCHRLKLSLGLGGDGELARFAVGPLAVEQAHLADRVIQGGAKVVKNVSEDDPEHDRRFLTDLKRLDPFPGVRIEFADRMVGLRLLVEEPVHRLGEFIELSFCPVELFDGPRKAVV